MQRVMRAAVALAIALGPAGAVAQEKTPGEERLEALERRLAEQEEEIEALKAREAGQPAPDAKADRPASAAERGEKFEKTFGFDALATWQEGFWLRYVDESEPDPEKRVLHSLRLSTRVQSDFRLFAEDDHPGDSTFLIRRARLAFTGTFYHHIDFSAEVDFAANEADLKDAWVQLSYFKPAMLRAGNLRVPMSREALTSSRYINFIERPMIIGLLAIDREIGAQVHGDLGFANYQIALTNGNPVNSRDNNDDKDGWVRLALTPFKPGKGLLGDVEVAASYNYGHTNGFRQRLRTYGETVLFDVNPGATGNPFSDQTGTRQRAGAEVTLPIGPFKAQGEFLYQRVEGNQVGPDDLALDYHGWYVDLLYMLTGESMGTAKRVIPKKNFDPGEGGLGAWGLGVRFEQVQAEEALRGAFGGGRTDEVNALTAGLNWYLNPNTRVMLNYYRAWFDETIATGGETLDNEDVVLLRLQFEF